MINSFIKVDINVVQSALDVNKFIIKTSIILFIYSIFLSILSTFDVKSVLGDILSFFADFFPISNMLNWQN